MIIWKKNSEQLSGRDKTEHYFADGMVEVSFSAGPQISKETPGVKKITETQLIPRKLVDKWAKIYVLAGLT